MVGPFVMFGDRVVVAGMGTRQSFSLRLRPSRCTVDNVTQIHIANYKALEVSFKTCSNAVDGEGVKVRGVACLLSLSMLRERVRHVPH